ncbi:ABC transporter substrate-binding protein [Martelella radicis]|uniref:Peptide/nickel transport system substrate-binding protein n=1 Tax=Martelella radicis TaxID=1397476 RepID=A0A7W6KKA8_9HYPH|nr:ABC transporter substrate-binding protein [Martelella radicis]MBB4122595.1 peptide/nickel transport system substrate-binding protein [Martelella radicis]
MITIALEKVDFLPADRVTDDASILTLKNLVMEPMLRWENGAPRPGLFDRWSLSEDGCRWTLTLREGAAYHDGSAVAAEDAKCFIEAICDARDMFGMPWSYARYLEGASFEASGATLEIMTPKPFPDLPDILSEFYLPKLDGAGQPTLGTGPWQVKDFDRGRSVTLGDAAGRSLRFLAIAGAGERLSALRAGDVQLATHLERLETPARSLEGYAWHEQATTMSVIAYMNGSEGAFSDPALRLAANLAIDRARLIDEVMGGLGVPARTIVSPFHNGMSPELAAIPFDPEGAARLVGESSEKREIVLRTPLYMPERAPETAAFIRDCLQAVGFSVSIDIAEDRPGYARELGEKRTGDLAIFDSSPHSTFRVLDDKISSRSRAVWWQGVEDPLVDALFEEARRSVDPQTRTGLYGGILAHLGANPHWLYLYHPIDCMARKPGLEGFSLDPKGILRVA